MGKFQHGDVVLVALPDTSIDRRNPWHIIAGYVNGKTGTITGIASASMLAGGMVYIVTFDAVVSTEYPWQSLPIDEVWLEKVINQAT